MRKLTLYTLVLLAAVVAACDMQKEVDLKLPEYESQMAVECYLQPGQPYILSLIESVPYYDNIRIKYVTDATVTIAHNGKTITLNRFGVAVPDSLDELGVLKPIIGDTIYTYVAFDVVPENYYQDFTLEITRANGDKLFATTQILPPVKIDTMTYKYNDDQKAFVLTKFQDDPDRANFYRVVLQRHNLNDNPDQDFFVNDEITNGEEFSFGTAFEYEKGDTLIRTVYHITEDYYRYLETSSAATDANYNPFGQPATIKSNISGGLGIFTGITFDRRWLYIE
ncbi:MAG: DUF4249 domain-containing protein [Bacteroidia bacterium]